VQGLAGPAQLDALDEHPDPGDQAEQAEQQREGDRADAGAGAQLAKILSGKIKTAIYHRY